MWSLSGRKRSAIAASAVGVLAMCLLSACGGGAQPAKSAGGKAGSSTTAGPTTCQKGQAGFIGGISVPEEPATGVATLSGNCWAQIAPTPVANVISGVGTGQIPGGKDPTLQVAWSPKAVYFLCTVYAWPLYAASSTAPWSDDACEFMVSGSAQRTGAFTPYAAQIGVAYNNPKPGIGTAGSNMTNPPGLVAQTKTNSGKGYEVELTVPWSTIGVSKPAKGQTYAFDAAVDFNNAKGSYVAYVDLAGTNPHPCCSTSAWTNLNLV